MAQSDRELAMDAVQDSDVREERRPRSELLYGLTDKPPVAESFFVALQHVLAAFVGIITPPLIICSGLGLDATNTSYIISMSLFASGLCTFIQCRKFGPVGSGLLSLQGTSFAFLGPILGVGTTAIQGGSTPQQALALIFGVCFFGSFVEIILSRFLHLMSRIITPVVSGTVVMIIGLGLIKTGVISMAGGPAALARNDGSFGSVQNLALSGLVLLLVVFLTLSRNRFLRMGAIVIGLAVGYVISLILGIVDFSALSQLPPVTLPIPFRFGMRFEIGAFLPFILLYVLTAIETVGDLTATSAVSGEPVQGPVYMRRIKGGVLGDGVNSAIAAVLNTFPNTTFSQNNGVIQMTGVGSRYVGFYVAGIFAVLGLLPIVGGVFQALPQPVLGGATTVMFGSIAVAGLNIVASAHLDRRAMIIVAVSLAMGLGVLYAPEIFADKPPMIKNLFGSSISTGGLTAILLSWLLPHNSARTEEEVEA
ncbi:MAG: uracil-xanthine permease family protein [Leptolyngbya sp. IPPAS B-1204]|uniref:Purine permease n=1 Tax=Leptolyngbya sp. NK1-12 TaxID=2547451 RepID=A0AA96WH16_9CYAN|nr:nucleobase:cation symporter-2 family protein [Leptolyngbya sp. NK1-12]MBF2051706.1 purine permease [Elainella sp. C42_A2020_010]RNJ66971.1 MAG: purine permease [Leptolyngbya sp. IPPAS B-1204]WNZ24925.1 purine permease [Leptolyngbya sp. NK1-12]